MIKVKYKWLPTSPRFCRLIITSIYPIVLIPRWLLSPMSSLAWSSKIRYLKKNCNEFAHEFAWAWDLKLEPTGAWKLSFRPHGPRARQHIFHSPPSCWDNLETTHSCAEGPPTSCTNHASSTSQTRPQQSSEPVTKRVLSGLKDAVVTLARICSHGASFNSAELLEPIPTLLVVAWARHRTWMPNKAVHQLPSRHAPNQSSQVCANSHSLKAVKAGPWFVIVEPGRYVLSYDLSLL